MQAATKTNEKPVNYSIKLLLAAFKGYILMLLYMVLYVVTSLSEEI
jgi:hypothetical protein